MARKKTSKRRNVKKSKPEREKEKAMKFKPAFPELWPAKR